MLKRASVPVSDLLKIYLSMIRPLLEYACQVRHTSLTGVQSDRLEASRYTAPRTTHCPPRFLLPNGAQQSGLPRLPGRREDLCRNFFRDVLPAARDMPYGLRSHAELSSIHARCGRFIKTMSAVLLQPPDCFSLVALCRGPLLLRICLILISSIFIHIRSFNCSSFLLQL